VVLLCVQPETVTLDPSKPSRGITDILNLSFFGTHTRAQLPLTGISQLIIALLPPSMANSIEKGIKIYDKLDADVILIRQHSATRVY